MIWQANHRIGIGKRILLFFLIMVTVSGLALAELIVREEEYPVDRDGWYSSLEEVAVYLAKYGRLPKNFITKKEAQALGWVSRWGNLWDVAEGCSIGGDRYGNYEGQLPDAYGRKWTECDIEYEGGHRGGSRIVFSNDGLLYYTLDHYNTFDDILVILSQKNREKPKKTKKRRLPETQTAPYRRPKSRKKEKAIPTGKMCQRIFCSMGSCR